LITGALAEALVRSDDVQVIATLDKRRNHPALQTLGWTVLGYTATELAAVDPPTPNARVEVETGTPSVAEAAALVAAGVGGELVVTKRSSAHATVAVARMATTRRPSTSPGA
jgi:cobalamin biosynthesis protein CbiG